MRRASKGTLNRTSSLKPWIALFVVAIIFGFYGIYTLLQSSAAPAGSFWGNGSKIADYSVYADTNNAEEQHPAGSIFVRNYYLSVPPNGLRPQGPHHIQFYMRWYKNQIEHQENKFVCGDATACVKLTVQEPFSELSNLMYCFDVTPEMQNLGNVKLFTTEFKQISTSGQNWVDDLLYMFSGSCTGEYESGPPSSSPNYLGYSHIGNGSLGNGTAGSDGSTGDDGNTQRDTGTGNDDQGAGSGGGGGGSSAIKQSTDPNSVPSSTSQGTEAKQPDLEASPFFDGKQYEPGSDPDILGVDTTFSIAGRNLKYGWLFVVALLIMGGSGAGYWYWRKRQGK